MRPAHEGKEVRAVDAANGVPPAMQAAFGPTGAVVESASNGNMAVELAIKNDPDVVVLDMMLPGRSGFLVLEKIKARKPKAEKPKKQNASNPSQKEGVVRGLENFKN